LEIPQLEKLFRAYKARFILANKVSPDTLIVSPALWEIKELVSLIEKSSRPGDLNILIGEGSTTCHPRQALFRHKYYFWYRLSRKRVAFITTRDEIDAELCRFNLMPGKPQEQEISLPETHYPTTAEEIAGLLDDEQN